MPGVAGSIPDIAGMRAMNLPPKTPMERYTTGMQLIAAICAQLAGMFLQTMNGIFFQVIWEEPRWRGVNLKKQEPFTGRHQTVEQQMKPYIPLYLAGAGPIPVCTKIWEVMVNGGVQLLVLRMFPIIATFISAMAP